MLEYLDASRLKSKNKISFRTNLEKKLNFRPKLSNYRDCSRRNEFHFVSFFEFRKTNISEERTRMSERFRESVFIFFNFVLRFCSVCCPLWVFFFFSFLNTISEMKTVKKNEKQFYPIYRSEIDRWTDQISNESQEINLFSRPQPSVTVHGSQFILFTTNFHKAFLYDSVSRVRINV